MTTGGRACFAMALAALGLGFAIGGPAVAADLGAGCCADLEQRIAELEETTARKGNRKVSLTVSGWINDALFWWDDGTQRDVYEGTNMVEQSRVKFLGEAKIDKDWSAGYLLEIALAGHVSNRWNQIGDKSISFNPAHRDGAVFGRKSFWFIRSKQLGQISVGHLGTSTYHLLDDADATLTRNIDDAEGASIYMSAFLIRSGGSLVNGLRWPDVLRGFNNSTPGQSARRNIVRYDSSEFAGFAVSASFGEDDIWDAALTFQKDIGDFSVLARAGYGASKDPGTMRGIPGQTYVVGGTPCISSSTTATSLPGFECTWEGAAATIQHKPTGLFVFGGWGRQSIATDHVFPAGTVLEPDSTTWFIQPGIERTWIPLGMTDFFVEYRHDDPGSNPGKTVSASIDFWQAGVIQRLEAADMNLYLIYQYADGDITGNAATAASGAPIGKTSIDGFQEIVGGAKINF